MRDVGARDLVAGEGLYERYKDALKKGHVAALKGRLDEALDAYAEASRIAPERSTPHTAAGTALLRRKRPADALAYYEAAARLAPRDEAALLGRAQALVALDRRADAADAYDALAEVRARSGKLADAVDAARRALELAEGRERRRTLERLIGRLRGSGIDASGRAALDRALRVLEGPKVAPPVEDAVAGRGRRDGGRRRGDGRTGTRRAAGRRRPRSRGRPRSSAAPSRSRRTPPALSRSPSPEPRSRRRTSRPWRDEALGETDLEVVAEAPATADAVGRWDRWSVSARGSL